MWDWYGRYLRGASSSWISRTGDGCRFLGGVTGVAGITPSGAVDDPCCRSGTFPDEDSGKDVVAENVYSVQLRRIRAGAVHRFAPGLIYILTGRLFSRPVSWSRLQKNYYTYILVSQNFGRSVLSMWTCSSSPSWQDVEHRGPVSRNQGKLGSRRCRQRSFAWRREPASISWGTSLSGERRKRSRRKVPGPRHLRCGGTAGRVSDRE